MTVLLVDTSVLVKWFHTEGEAEVAAAHAIRSAHVTGAVDAAILDLGWYELGNVLLHALRWSAADVTDQLNDLHAIVGAGLTMPDEAWRAAASLGEQHALSFYDASWAAAAAELAIPLVSADRRLLAAGLAESATQIAERLRLPLA